MRINLEVPYADKDLAKARGAKWDCARKVWYIENAPSLIKFWQWMPDRLKEGMGEGKVNKLNSLASKPAPKKPKKHAAPKKKTKAEKKAAKRLAERERITRHLDAKAIQGASGLL